MTLRLKRLTVRKAFVDRLQDDADGYKCMTMQGFIDGLRSLGIDNLTTQEIVCLKTVLCGSETENSVFYLDDLVSKLRRSKPRKSKTIQSIGNLDETSIMALIRLTAILKLNHISVS